MGTTRIKKDSGGFGKATSRMTVAERKKVRRLLVRKMVEELKAAGKPVDLQAINQEVLFMCKRKRQGHKPRHGTQAIKK